MADNPDPTDPGGAAGGQQAPGAEEGDTGDLELTIDLPDVLPPSTTQAADAMPRIVEAHTVSASTKGAVTEEVAHVGSSHFTRTVKQEQVQYMNPANVYGSYPVYPPVMAAPGMRPQYISPLMAALPDAPNIPQERQETLGPPVANRGGITYYVPMTIPGTTTARPAAPVTVVSSSGPIPYPPYGMQPGVMMQLPTGQIAAAYPTPPPTALRQPAPVVPVPGTSGQTTTAATAATTGAAGTSGGTAGGGALPATTTAGTAATTGAAATSGQQAGGGALPATTTDETAATTAAAATSGQTAGGGALPATTTDETAATTGGDGTSGKGKGKGKGKGRKVIIPLRKRPPTRASAAMAAQASKDAQVQGDDEDEEEEEGLDLDDDVADPSWVDKEKSASSQSSSAEGEDRESAEGGDVGDAEDPGATDDVPIPVSDPDVSTL